MVGVIAEESRHVMTRRLASVANDKKIPGVLTEMQTTKGYTNRIGVGGWLVSSRWSLMVVLLGTTEMDESNSDPSLSAS
jgi:hypothetical protein